MNNPFFTVYVVNYNYSKYVLDALTSLDRQTFSNFEVLIYDDGSTDDSVKVIEEFLLRSDLDCIF